MTDLMTDFAPVPPPPDGFARAIATARRRRLRTAGLSTGVAGAGLAIAAVLVGSSGQSSLSQEAPLTKQPTQGPAAERGTPAPNVVQVSGSPAASTVAAVASAQSSADAHVVPGPVPRQTTGPHYVAAPITSKDNQLTVPNCLGGGPPACVVTQRAEGALITQACSTETSTVLLHYADAREADFWVTRGKTTVWQWSASHPATGEAHLAQLDSGHCSEWSMSWNAVDGQGRPLPAGDYVLHSRVLARETPSVADFAFTL